jgi:ArsR family transcriptional regulator
VDTSTIVDPTALDVDDASRTFAALADPARLRVLAVLADSPQCVCEIQSAVPIAANLLSYHLRTLREAGLVEGERRGRFIDYRLTDGAGERLQAALGCAGFVAAIGRPVGDPPALRVPGP